MKSFTIELSDPVLLFIKLTDKTWKNISYRNITRLVKYDTSYRKFFNMC